MKPKRNILKPISWAKQIKIYKINHKIKKAKTEKGKEYANEQVSVAVRQDN